MGVPLQLPPAAMASSPESGIASSPGADSDTAARFRRAKSVENTPSDTAARFHRAKSVENTPSDTAARFRRAKSVENTPGTRTPMKDTRTTPDKAEKPSDRVP